jgi:hypothetical protein
MERALEEAREKVRISASFLQSRAAHAYNRSPSAHTGYVPEEVFHNDDSPMLTFLRDRSVLEETRMPRRS